MDNKTGRHIANVSGGHVGVYAISLVDKPANKAQFVNPCKSGLCSLSENNEIVGLILRPEQEINRLNEDGTDWTLLFDIDGVKQAHESFAKNLALKNSNLQHTEKWQDGITFVESWLVENTEHDKSIEYGFQPKLGEWYVKAKVENSEVLQALKSDEVKGFSLEGDFGLSAIKLNETQTINLNKKTMNILKIFGIDSKDAEKVKLAEDLEQKLATIDDVKAALASLVEVVNGLTPPEQSPEEMEAEKKAAEEMAVADKAEADKKEAEMAEQKSEIATLKEQLTKLTDQVKTIPVDFETFREKLTLSDEQKLKLEEEKVSKMSINELIEYNKNKKN